MATLKTMASTLKNFGVAITEVEATRSWGGYNERYTRYDAKFCGVIREILQAEGKYFLLLEGIPGFEFFCSPNTQGYRDLKWSQKGDQIKIAFQITGVDSIEILSFDNPEARIYK